MYALKRASLLSFSTLFLGLLFSNSAIAQIDASAEAQCTGVTQDQHYIINVTNIPTTGDFEIYINGSLVGTTNSGSFTSDEIAFDDGTITNLVEVRDVSDATNTAEIMVHEVLCTDVNQDGNFDFNTDVCDYTKPLGTGGAIVSTVAPYNSANVYLYVLTGQDGIYQTGTSEDLNSYTPPGEPTCYALCGSADYTVDCESIVDIYVDPSDEEVCMEGDATFFIQDSIIAPVPDNADLTYQWQVDDGSGTYVNVGGETDSTLMLEDVVFADSGNMYRVIVTLVVDGTEISMDTSGVATLTVYDDPVLAADQDVTVNSDEPTGIDLTLDDGSVAADSFEIVTITVGDDLDGDPDNVDPGIYVDSDVIADDMFTNTGVGPDTVFYDIVPISEHGCRGDTVTIYVEVRDGSSTGLPSTDDNGLVLDSLTVTSSVGSNIAGTAFSGLVLPANLDVITLDTFTNVSDAVDSVVYTITPYANNCAGSPFELVIEIDPEPVFEDVVQDVCSDEEIGIDLAFTDDSGLDIQSVSITAAVGGGLTGDATEGTDLTSTSAISADVFTNTGTATDSVVYTVTPTSTDGCEGESYQIVVRITTEPVGSDPEPTVCSDEISDIVLDDLITNSSSGVSFTWFADDNPNVTGEPSGSQSSDTISIQLTNTSDNSEEVVFNVIPTDGATCIGDTFTVTVTVLPAPEFDDETATVCSDEDLDIDISLSQTNGVDVSGYTYTVVSSNEEGVPAGDDRTDTSAVNITDSYSNTTGSDVTIIYTVTPISSSDCEGAEFDITVTVRSSSMTSLDEEICAGDDFTVGSSTYDETGIYMDTLTAANGCDSIVTLDLTVLPLATTSLDEEICSGESFTVGTSTYTESGTFVDTISAGAANGCDSIVTLNLTVIPKPEDSVTDATICEGETFTWTVNGEEYTTAQTGLRITNDGCTADDVLNLTVDPAVVVDLDTEATICSTENVDLTDIGAGISGGATSGTWSVVGGGGTFDEGTAFPGATTFTPSEDQIDSGEITLTLTSETPEGPCPSESASITVSILDIRCSEFPWDGND